MLLGLLLGISVYLAATIFLRVFTGQEQKLIAELLPAPVRNRIATLSHE